MRILLLASYFPKPGNPLIGTWALDQAQALRRAGAQVEVISLTPWIPRWPGQRATWQAYSRCPAAARWDGLAAHYPRWFVYAISQFEHRFQQNPERWLAFAWRFCGSQVLALARAFKPDCIFAHHTSVNGWVARELARSLNIRYFTQDHAQWEIAICAQNRAMRLLYEKIGAEATAMLAVSRRMESDLRALLPQAKVIRVPNGANLPSPAKERSVAARPPVVFSAGMFVHYKGFDLLLQAWPGVLAVHPEARLRIAGDGPDRNKLHALARALNLTDSIEFLGYLPQSAVRAEMGAACLFVLASWQETFGVVFLEAAACGTPGVWATNAGVTDVLAAEVHGLSFTPHDPESITRAIIALLDDPQQAARMGVAAARLVESSLTWDAVARTLLSTFSTSASA